MRSTWFLGCCAEIRIAMFENMLKEIKELQGNPGGKNSQAKIQAYSKS